MIGKAGGEAASVRPGGAGGPQSTLLDQTFPHIPEIAEDRHMNKVFANRNSRGDFVFNEFERHCDPPRHVYIATAFFTDIDLVRKMVFKGCTVLMVVRLGFPTSPDAVEAAIKLGVQLRVYTGRSFHPKLYIFGDDVALVGSANLTKAALVTNQEVVVAIENSDPRFADLATVFEEYWSSANIPTTDQLKIYRQTYLAISKIDGAAEVAMDEFIRKVGETSPDNIDRSKPKAEKSTVFLEGYRRSYQETVAAFRVVRRVYERSGFRKTSEIPLRIEIDSFISFVRDTFTHGESWAEGPLRSEAEQEAIIETALTQWKTTPWPHFEHRIVHETYPRLMKVFENAASIKAASDSDLFDALATLHSFHDRLRFFLGGLAGWKKEFIARNDPQRLRKSLIYLVHGSGDPIERMANVIYSAEHKLEEFGTSGVQELVGWCNDDELPILNGRTTKVLRYFGAKVRQVS